MSSREEQRFLKKLGQRLAVQRKAKAITQEDLAARTELNRNTIALIEGGRRGTTTPTLFRIAKAIDVSLEDIFKGL